jgi:hypothetical protein
LLILAGEIVFADRPPDPVKGGERLALGMQGLALTSSKAIRQSTGPVVWIKKPVEAAERSTQRAGRLRREWWAAKDQSAQAIIKQLVNQSATGEWRAALGYELIVADGPGPGTAAHM